MRKHSLITLFAACLLAPCMADVTAPDGKISVTQHGASLTVSYGGKNVLEIAQVADSTAPFQFVQKVTADYKMLSGKRLQCHNEANEYRNGNLTLRLYNDGIAFRLDSAQQEQTAYHIPDGTRRWLMRWADSYEGFFPLTTTSPDGRWGYPALLEPHDSTFVLLTEANIGRGQSASSLHSKGEIFRVVADDPNPQSPWRVAIIGSLADVVQSTLVTDVSDPCKLADVSWIQPGVVSWIYWANNHGSNDYDIIKKYVDLAVTLKLPYVLIDAEWDEMKNGKTIEDAVRYAVSQGVKPLIWYNSSIGWINGAPGPKFRLNNPEDREREFAWCESIGVAGVKIDFFSGDNNRNMAYCIDLLECAAKHHLTVNFHGAPIPRGWQRTYPNLLSTEGVYGAEWYNNVPTFTQRAARHNATLPFTRNVIGPMDYTPCAFSDSQHPHITTHAHELALTVLYESGLQHIADRPESLLAQPMEVQRFFGQLPTAWDETRLLSGYPGESVVMARRKGDIWYVAGINGRDEAQTLAIPQDFLSLVNDPTGVNITSFADAGDRAWNISFATKLPAQVECRPRGGFVFEVRPAYKSKFETLAPNALRLRYGKPSSLPDWIYEGRVDTSAESSLQFVCGVADGSQYIALRDRGGKEVMRMDYPQLRDGIATLAIQTAPDECLYGLGQFQDGYNNVAGLPRRLTQVNTQISVPVLISSKGYGIIWNNYAKTDFNLPERNVRLLKTAQGETETVNVTSTEGGKREVRRKNLFEGEITVDEDGQYALLLDVGQKMARRHNLKIDGRTVIEMQNMWLPPTASTIVTLAKGTHKLSAELTENDRPVLWYGKVKNRATFRSEPTDAVDCTVIQGTPDEIIATYRRLTGEAPLMPAWALGYIHCRERFHTQQEIISTADRFAQENIPLDVIVQDWQYWGKNGWNSMVFDADNYPDPKALTDYLHSKNIRMMLSVWSKIDRNSQVGKEMASANHYIPNTDWIDFFNPDAAAAYWRNFSQKLLPLGIDAWWQDATEPENDDLAGRRVANGTIDGNRVRNVYPMLVNKTVYEGLRRDQPNRRPMILTRSGFLGIQRYGSALWSGDVGNDWETLRRQITGGLGLQAAGVPWWTYDAGGFFRPRNQYTDAAYIARMLRWIELSVYLPLMRVHGYMSDTEPWRYGAEAQHIITRCIERRKQLQPYIYSHAAAIAFDGSTLMRPLVFDFAADAQALQQRYEYMFGKSLLVSPVTQPDVTSWPTYLPKNEGGWYDIGHQNAHYAGSQTVNTTIDGAQIPVFARAGSIVVEQGAADALVIKVFAGADAEFTLYEDDGTSLDFQNGQFTKTQLVWNDAAKTLSLKSLDGKLPVKHTFEVSVIGQGTQPSAKTVKFKGKSQKVKF